MSASTEQNELAAALAEAQAEMKGVRKSGHNSHDGYGYAKLEDVVKASTPILAKHGISVLTSVTDVASLETRQTKSGGNIYPVRVKGVTVIMHKSGQWRECLCWGDGEDRGDKGIYKAITGMRKYGLSAALNLATTDNPEDGNPRDGEDDGGEQQQSGPLPAGRSQQQTQRGRTQSDDIL
jgi:hypothetical protein